MSKSKKELTILDYHEALDRTYLMTSIVNDALMEHQVILKHEELHEKIESAIALLAEAYQLIGGLEFSLFPNEFKVADEKSISKQKH